LGQGAFRYRPVPEWGVLDSTTPVKNCHGIVCDNEGHIILLTDHTANNVIIYEKSGKLVHKWGTSYPGAHGLSIVNEGSHQVLYITDLQRHRVIKTTLDGKQLEEWCWPEMSGKYTREEEYRPSWTIHFPDGSFYVLDGYGKDYIPHYDSTGSFVKLLGGAEGGIKHWGPHGGMADIRPEKAESMLIAMSDQQHLLRMDREGNIQETIPLPGGNPRQIRKHGNHYFVGHLADNWPSDRNSRGFLSVLNSELQIVSNIGGTDPIYNNDGILQPMKNNSSVFLHPHDLVVDSEDSIYVAQFSSGQTYPIKLERL